VPFRAYRVAHSRRNACRVAGPDSQTPGGQLREVILVFLLELEHLNPCKADKNMDGQGSSSEGQ
jgi:hypothetical protein